MTPVEYAEKIDLDRAREASQEITSALDSLGFASPDGMLVHVERIAIAMNELVDSLCLQSPGTDEPPTTGPAYRPTQWDRMLGDEAPTAVPSRKDGPGVPETSGHAWCPWRCLTCGAYSKGSPPERPCIVVACDVP